MPESIECHDAQARHIDGLTAMIGETASRLIGRAMRSLRAGDEYLAWHDAALAGAPASIRLSSPAFDDGTIIPTRYAGEGVGDNMSPPLSWSEIPEDTAELVLIMQDPDAPLPRPVVHLIAAGLPAETGGVAEGALGPFASPGIKLGRTSFGRRAYAGPRALRGHGTHRYVFQLVALRRPLVLSQTPGLGEVLSAMRGNAIARGRLIGLFERS